MQTEWDEKKKGGSCVCVLIDAITFSLPLLTKPDRLIDDKKQTKKENNTSLRCKTRCATYYTLCTLKRASIFLCN